MNEDQEYLKTWLDNVGSRWKLLEAEAKRGNFPDDLGAVLDAYAQAADDLPADMASEKRTIKGLIKHTRKYLDKGETLKVKTHILDIKDEIERARHIGYLNATSRQLGQAGKQRAADIKEERQPIYDQWQAEADRIRAGSAAKLSKVSLAEIIKRNLDAPDSVETIRKRIK
jgi:hypothetical protein